MHDHQRAACHRLESFAHARRQAAAWRALRRAAPCRRGASVPAAIGASRCCKSLPCHACVSRTARRPSRRPSAANSGIRGRCGPSGRSETSRYAGSVVAARLRGRRPRRACRRPTAARSTSSTAISKSSPARRCSDRRAGATIAANLRASISQQRDAANDAPRIGVPQPGHEASQLVFDRRRDRDAGARTEQHRGEILDAACARTCAPRSRRRTRARSAPNASKSPRPANSTNSARSARRAAGITNTWPSWPGNMRRSVNSRIAPPRRRSTAAGRAGRIDVAEHAEHQRPRIGLDDAAAHEAQFEHALASGDGLGGAHRVCSAQGLPEPEPVRSGTHPHVDDAIAAAREVQREREALAGDQRPIEAHQHQVQALRRQRRPSCRAGTSTPSTARMRAMPPASSTEWRCVIAARGVLALARRSAFAPPTIVSVDGRNVGAGRRGASPCIARGGRASACARRCREERRRPAARARSPRGRSLAGLLFHRRRGSPPRPRRWPGRESSTGARPRRWCAPAPASRTA